MACLLRNVTRTKPQVAFGCRSSNRTISSAVKLPAIPDPSGLVCAIESDGRTADNPAAAPAASKGLRPTSFLDIALILSWPIQCTRAESRARHTSYDDGGFSG